MALRRSLGSLSSILNGLQRLTLLEAPSAAQQLAAASTLSSLRCLAPVAAQAARSSSAAAAAGCRQYAAAAAQAAAPAAAEEESLEEIRSRIFGTHIGEVWLRWEGMWLARRLAVQHRAPATCSRAL